MSPTKRTAKATLSGTLKDEVNVKAAELIDNVLKPKFIRPPSEGVEFNYIVDITTKWIGSTCFFISVYACPEANAVSPTFEEKFARMAYAGNDKFTLSFMRHTGEWVELFAGISVDECLNSIQNDPWFQP